MARVRKGGVVGSATAKLDKFSQIPSTDPRPWQPAFSSLSKVGSPSKAESALHPSTVPADPKGPKSLKHPKLGSLNGRATGSPLGAGSLRNQPSNESTGLHQSQCRQVYILISFGDLLYVATKMLTSEF